MFAEWKAEQEAYVQNMAYSLDGALYWYVRVCGAGTLVTKGHIKTEK